MILDFFLILLWYLAYTYIYKLLNLKEKSINNSKQIIHLEKKLNIFYEEKIQKLVINHFPTVFNFFNFIYIFNHALTTIGLLLYIIINNNNITNNIKLVFYCGNLISLFSYVYYPLIPPRLLNSKSKYGSTDKSYNFIENNINNNICDNVNHYAAMPSMHIFNAVWFSHSIYIINNSLYIFIHPILTLITIIVTGHHYIIDSIMGVLLYMVCIILI